MPDEGRMKMLRNIVWILCMASLLFFSGAAFAQQLSGESTASTTASEAERFFQDCMKKPVVPVSEETDTAFCACAATQVHIWHSKPPTESTGPLNTVLTKELDANALYAQIYSPCLHIPIYDLSYGECLENKKYRYFLNRSDLLDATCQCIGQGDSSYFEKFAQPYIELQISKGVKFEDPIREIKRDPNFYEAHYNLETNCYTEYANQQ